VKIALEYIINTSFYAVYVVRKSIGSGENASEILHFVTERKFREQLSEYKVLKKAVFSVVSYVSHYVLKYQGTFCTEYSYCLHFSCFYGRTSLMTLAAQTRA
jgi:hypothetical protein